MNDFLEKPLPSNKEAERCIVGGIVLDNSLITQAINVLLPSDFYTPLHKRVFQVMCNLFKQGKAIDPILISEEMKKEGEAIESYGGIASITNLTYGLPHFSDITEYVRVVKEKAVARAFIKESSASISQALAEESSIEDVIATHEQAIFNLRRNDKTEIVSVGDMSGDEINNVISFAKKNHSNNALLGLSTGFAQLNQMLSGLIKSDLILVAGRSSMGKTSLALNFAQNACTEETENVVLVFTLEMSKPQIVNRFLCQKAKVDASRYRIGHLLPNEWQKIGEADDWFKSRNILIDDTPGVSPLQIKSKALEVATRRKRLDLIVVDYIQLMRVGGKVESRQQEVSEISRNLKALAKELNVPVVALSQLSRAPELRADKRPILSDLRESGCLTGETLVTIADSGERVAIKDLVGSSGFRVWSINQANWKLEKGVVTNAFSTGIKPVFRLTTKLGRSIRATANHKFLTFNGWKCLDGIVAGEYLAMPRKIDNTVIKQTMTNDEVALLGHLIGDGCTLPTHAIQYTTGEKDLAELVSTLATNVFRGGVKPRIKQEKTWFQVYIASKRKTTHGVRNPVSDWLKSLEIWGLRSHEKRVPDAIFCQPSSVIAHFLRNLWSTDGSIRLNQGEKPKPNVYYSSSSERLARDVQMLLLRLGINAWLREYSQNGKGRNQFQVSITGKDDLLKFIEIIGAVGQYKNNSLAEIITFLKPKTANTNRDVIPFDVWRKRVLPAMRKNKITGRMLAKELQMSYCGTSLYKQNLSRERLLRIADVTQSPDAVMLAQSDIYWDKVVSVEPDGEEEVFDLTVKDYANFEANGFLPHNSLEQDCDVCLFVYRDEYYKKTESNQGKAEIIVAKNRNGATGVNHVAFLSEFSTFEELARVR